MSRTRFALALAVLALVSAVGSFVGGYAILDDGRPDPAPSARPDGGDALASDPAVTTSSTATAPPSTIGSGLLPSPSWVTVVASGPDEATARAVAERVAAAGHRAGVLRSDDYPSLAKGLWVAYAGPHPDRSAAEAAVAALADDGFSEAYERCAGTKRDCSGD